ncbi:MAG: site-specific DNA-methyltransferase [Firmicutes bacterium]|nr:site-specific DNA-methyltransferase [Bacillota bacterium]
MNVLMELPGIFQEASEKYRTLLTVNSPAEKAASVRRNGVRFVNGDLPAPEYENELVFGDNLDVLVNGLRSGALRSCIDLIYCDPPFFTRGEQAACLAVHSRRFPEIKELRVAAYNDSSRTGFREYLTDMTLRLMLMRDALSETGSILIHLDSRAVHSVKLLMDAVFGEDHFINEIIWTYKSGGASGRYLARKHDNILFYSKSEHYKFHVIREKSYNRGLKPYRFRGVEEFQDDIGWYTMVRQKDVWQVDMVGRSSRERLQYATQKPEALLDRIITMTTDEGDLCADFYCGSGTLAASALRLGRHFLCVDQTRLAVSNAMKRPLRDGHAFLLRQGAAQDDVNEDPVVNGFLDGALTARRKGGHIFLRPSAEPAGEKQAEGAGTTRIAAKASDRLAILRAEDPEALIDYWCIGSLEENGVFRCGRMIRRHGKEQIISAEAEPEDTHVWVADLCGGMTVIKIENEE